MRAYLALLVLNSFTYSFLLNPALPNCHALRLKVKNAMAMSVVENGRRDFLLTSLTTVSIALSVPRDACASVYFEIDRYGDKELKLGTVSKIRQAWRNKMLEDPEIAPLILKLAINDALGYNAKTTSGGPDGSVVFEMGREENKGLESALKSCLTIMANLKRTSEISLSDIIAFGGGEAIEATGGPRVVIQLGRYDDKTVANPAEPIPGYSFEEPTGLGMKTAFKRSGLGAKDALLVLSALGTITEITKEAAANKTFEEEDDLVDSSWEKSLPKSFGGQSEIYGSKIGRANFDTSYIRTILKNEKKSPGTLSPMDKALLQDSELKSYLMKYDGNEKAYSTDLAEAYNKLTQLGEQYENRIQSRD